jgi:hypothetical protein
MLDPESFLIELYVKVDDFDKTLPPRAANPGQQPSLSRSELVTLALFAQWGQFLSERAFYRYAQKNLLGLFPRLPARTQFNRQLRAERETIIDFSRMLVAELRTPEDLYQALDATAIMVRDHHRRGEGWLFGQADIGWSNRLGWYEGLHCLTSILPSGVIAGYGLAPASAKDQPLAETFLAARAYSMARLSCVGYYWQLPYLTDNGFEGQEWHQRWRADYGAEVITPPKRSAKKNWPQPWRKYLAGLRQIVETINDKLLNTFGLIRERPHCLAGLQARLAAKVALNNFCIWLNRKFQRPNLAFADLVNW